MLLIYSREDIIKPQNPLFEILLLVEVEQLLSVVEMNVQLWKSIYVFLCCS
jgi:hypothetical protein